jgi:hypothetical protein
VGCEAVGGGGGGKEWAEAVEWHCHVTCKGSSGVRRWRAERQGRRGSSLLVPGDSTRQLCLSSKHTGAVVPARVCSLPPGVTSRSVSITFVQRCRMHAHQLVKWDFA